MKSSYYLILLIIGIIILHAVDDRKKRKSQKQVEKPASVRFDSINSSADTLPSLAASFR
jgi:hypothetical protein